MLIITGFLLNAFSKSATFHVLTGTGTVTGRVIGPEGNPVKAEVFVPNTNLKIETDKDGNFTLQNVPAGERSIIVARDFGL